MPSLFMVLMALCISACGDAPVTARAPVVTSRLQIKEQRTSPLTYVSSTIAGARFSVQYGAPSVKGRSIWGELVPFGEVWRLGANEATWVETDKALRMGGKILEAGRYGLFCVPNDSVWTLIVNREWDQWGAYFYSETTDVFRIEVAVRPESSFSEVMRFGIESDELRFNWAGVAWSLPLSPV
jgi:hypothetical protein